MYLGKLNSFLRCFKCVQLNQNRVNSTRQETCDTIQKCLGLSRSQASALVKSHSLSKLSKENLMNTVDILNSFGYSKREIVDHGILLTRNSSRLHDQFLVLKEVGFDSVTPIVLINFRKLIHKTVRALKRMTFLSQDCNVINNLLIHLSPKPTNFLSDYKYDEEEIIAKMHCVIVKKYLQWRLDASVIEIESFFRQNRSLKFRSFQNLCKNIDFALNIGFTPRKLLSFGYVLTTNPLYPKTVIEDMPAIAGLDMKVAMRRCPKLITVSPRTFRSIYNILKEENIPDDAIRRVMSIFSLSPKTVKFRFDEIKSIPELNVLRHAPRILKLIVHHNRMRSRLSFIQDLHLKCCSMALLEHTSDPYFESRIKSGKDAHLFYEVVGLLSNMLKADTKDIEYILKQHPHHLQVPLLDIEKTVKFLQEGFSNAAITKVLPIVLYPSEKIQQTLKQIYAMEGTTIKNLSETKTLNMALYIIEKNHHFTGNGVWNGV